MASDSDPLFEWEVKFALDHEEEFKKHTQVLKDCRETFYLISKTHDRAKLALKNKDEKELRLLKEELSEHYKNLKRYQGVRSMVLFISFCYLLAI